MGRVVTALPGADRALVGGARLALPPGWRERDMVRVRMVVSSVEVEEGMVEIAVAWLKLFEVLWKCFFSLLSAQD